MRKEIRWGILSTARIGRAVVRGIGLSSNSCVQVVASRELGRAEAWATEQGIPRACGSYQELLEAEDVDAVYNPLPNSMHAEWTIRAMEAGKPVLCEKPFAVNADEARRVAEVSERTGITVAEAFMYRFHPIYDRVLECIAEGAVGAVTSIRCIFAFRLADRKDIRASAELAGGALMDVGCYCVNLSRRVAGCEPVRAHAFERRTTVDDTLFGSLEFPNGILAQFECSIESKLRWRAEIAGTDGLLLLDSPFDNPWFPGEERARFAIFDNHSERIVECPGANTYRLEVEDFAAALLEKHTPRWPLTDAIANMATIDALYAAARQGTAVNVQTP